ncbi:Altered inheritance of mitochondria protein [Actinidia chinensis var. chinensis]|uniref:Altered inheritance of mitochondria protein n=1 Tax=Actinidia chinensis var. chinensis TaxID=1590841 RepID=A0A2R6RTA0_ACTCC|nr:Altered inheritance of mitochondria protein [Actinidia chinensis var. chinensis]
MYTDFVIKNVEYVRAQVRVVKCNVKGIAVDISFNQMGGLSALCFLEQVDKLIGKDHLFKRSIILIKAWCYYESRTLGAFYGLIATYALNLLVLHILNLFHSSVNGPLSVLHRFLDYYSTFDWDKYCVSLNGRVALSSFPDIVVETPQNVGSGLLLGQEVLKNTIDVFPVSNWAKESSEQAFLKKYLNIIDPLKQNNNVGRSVSKANFSQIKHAFSLGAQKLGDIIMLPPESIDQGLKEFFETTLERNGKVRRQDVRIPVPVFLTGKSEIADLNGDYSSFLANIIYCGHYHNHDSSTQSIPPTSPSQVWNEDAGMQFNQIFVPPPKMRSCAPIPFFHPKAAQSSSAALVDGDIPKIRVTSTSMPTTSVEEMLKALSMDMYIPNTESRGTGTFIPDIRDQKKLMVQGRIYAEDKAKSMESETNVHEKSVNENYSSQGAVTRIPDMGVEKNAKPGVTGTYNHNLILEDKKSQGAGTGSSDQRSPYKQMPFRGRGRDDGQTTEGLVLKSSPKKEQVDVSSETKGESTSNINLSLEEFPLLPGSKKAVPPRSPQPGWPAEESSSAQKSQPVPVEFGFFGLPLSPLIESSQREGKELHFSFSTTMDSDLAEPSEDKKKEMIVEQPYKLEDDKDFPALSG